MLGSAWPLPRLWWDLPAPTTATSAAPGTLQEGVCYLRRQSTNCQGKQRCSSHAAPVRRGGEGALRGEVGTSSPMKLPGLQWCGSSQYPQLPPVPPLFKD